MATSKVQATEGSGINLATNSISEDAVTKQLTRVVPNTSAGVESGTAASPLQVSIANTGANSTPLVVASHAVTNAGTFATQAVAAGDVAHDGVDSGNPVKVGGQARTTNPTAVSDADRANFITDKLGKQIVVGAIRELKGVQATTITSSTGETTIVTQVASTFLDLYGLTLANKSGTATTVTIKDSTTGTTRFTIHVPAGDTRGFMLPVDSAVPQATVNTNWTATSSASIDSLYITALYVKNT